MRRNGDGYRPTGTAIPRVPTTGSGVKPSPPDQKTLRELRAAPAPRTTAWVGVDLDGTLARYDGWQGHGHIGEPIEPMLARVKAYLAAGVTVKLFTARGTVIGKERTVFLACWWDWCDRHGIPRLEVTASKDFQMVALWDDRARSVVTNVGLDVHGAAERVAELVFKGDVLPAQVEISEAEYKAAHEAVHALEDAFALAVDDRRFF